MHSATTLWWMIQGFLYPFRGMAFVVRHRRLLWYCTVPFCLNAILFSALLWFVVPKGWTWASGFLPGREAWYGAALYYVLLVLSAVLLAVVLMYAFTMIGNIILAPFNDFLSESVERVYVGTLYSGAFSLKTALADARRSIKAEASKLLLYLAGLGILLLLNLFPVVGSALASGLLVLYTLYFLGWEYIDYSMERWKFGFRRKMRTAAVNGPAFIGFGAGASLLLFLPLVNLMAIPVCAAGATLLFCDLRKDHRLPDSA